MPAIATLGSFRAFLVAVVLGGLIQVALAVLRAGTVAFYFPSTVIQGMLAAIGLILVLKQLPHALGYDVDFQGDEAFFQPTGENTFTTIANAIANVQPAAVVLAIASLAVLVLWERTRLAQLRWMPGPLAAVLLGVAGYWLITRLAPGWQLGAAHFVTLPSVADLEQRCRRDSRTGRRSAAPRRGVSP